MNYLSSSLASGRGEVGHEFGCCGGEDVALARVMLSLLHAEIGSVGIPMPDYERLSTFGGDDPPRLPDQFGYEEVPAPV
jgi:hypothetical protein